jgi:hypothetical protein
MRGDPCNPEVWFQVARRDIKAYGTLMASGDFHLATFCLQQASEKALKGWLIGRGWHLIKTHTLTLLQTEAQLHGLDLEWFTPSAERASPICILPTATWTSRQTPSLLKKKSEPWLRM